MNKNLFVKSHGLGNDYIIFDSSNITFDINENAIKRICDTHYGIGSDGILLLVPTGKADFGLRIFNPDGSEAEKSGNGIRIFSKFLFDYNYSKKENFTIDTPGGIVKSVINEKRNNKASLITVDMGKANFKSKEIPVICPNDECLDFPLRIKNKEYLINCVSVGNPHCVIIKDDLNETEIMEFGHLIETNSIFPNRINVQFAKALSDKEVKVLIWERGAGFTLASGSSSCAVASIMKKKGITGNNVDIIMPGGTLKISVHDSWDITMTGEVRQIAEGYLDDELLEDICLE